MLVKIITTWIAIGLIVFCFGALFLMILSEPMPPPPSKEEPHDDYQG